MMEQCVISVIIPVYKAEKYLSRCIASLLAQSFTAFELLLIDDGSPDNSGKICHDWAERDCRIRVLHQTNAGVSAARNKGLDEAKGEYIVFVDSDDYVGTDYLKHLYEERPLNLDSIVVQGFTVVSEQADRQYKSPMRAPALCSGRNSTLHSPDGKLLPSYPYPHIHHRFPRNGPGCRHLPTATRNQ